MKIHLSRPSGLTRPELVYGLPDKEYQSLTRSTLPSLCFWQEADRRAADLLKQLRFEYSSHADLCFEYSVPSHRNNHPSVTDIMYQSEGVSVGIEAKYTEPRYETVKKWRGDPPSMNKKKVLEHWLGMIQPFSTVQLEAECVSETVYQMVHRTASACFERTPEESKVGMVYQVFVEDGEPHVDYAKDLGRLSAALAPVDCLKLALQVVQLSPNQSYKSLKARVEKNSGDTAMLVRKAVLSESLFEFEPRPLEIIN